MSTVAKVFSDIVNNRLIYYMETMGEFVDEQNGFRRIRSCFDHLFVLTTIVRNRKKNNCPTHVCYIDFTRTFDSINHSLLWYKLYSSGIKGKILNIIKTIYSNTRSAVRVGCVLNDWFSANAGVRQGDNLGPTLFAICVNDLVSDINSLSRGVPIGNTSVSCLIYADDIVLTSDSCEHLQDQLNSVYAWCNKWRLRGNMSKTKIMHFRKSPVTRTNYKFMFGDTDITHCDSYRYLGLELNESLDYSHCVDVLSSASGRALGALVSRYYAINGLHYNTLYKTVQQPRGTGTGLRGCYMHCTDCAQRYVCNQPVKQNITNEFHTRHHRWYMSPSIWRDRASVWALLWSICRTLLPPNVWVYIFLVLQLIFSSYARLRSLKTTQYPPSCWIIGENTFLYVPWPVYQNTDI